MAENINCVPTDCLFTENFEDTIQTLKCFPNNQSNIIASGGWDCKLRLFDIKYQLQNTYNMYGGNNNNSKINYTVQKIGEQVLPNPILNCCWKGANQPQLLISDTEGKIYMFDVQANSVVPIGAHQQGVKELEYFEANNMSLLMSGGWDGVINFWDFRQQTPVFTFNVGLKIFSMSCTYPLLVVGMDQLKICYFNLNKLGYNNFGKEAEFLSHLKHQTRCIATFPDGGYALGSVEGRIAIKNVNLMQAPNIDKNTGLMSSQGDFAFRAHRMGNNNSDVYSVNCLTFNKAYGTFASGGSDGRFFLWDKSSKSKLKTGYFEDSAPITAMDYNITGDLFAYAAGYDWSKGLYGQLNTKPRIGVHVLIDDERKEKQTNQNQNQSTITSYLRK
jgi:mRNA export factor